MTKNPNIPTLVQFTDCDWKTAFVLRFYGPGCSKFQPNTETAFRGSVEKVLAPRMSDNETTETKELHALIPKQPVTLREEQSERRAGENWNCGSVTSG